MSHIEKGFNFLGRGVGGYSWLLWPASGFLKWLIGWKKCTFSALSKDEFFQNYEYDSNIGLFYIYYSPYSYRSFNFLMANFIDLNLFASNYRFCTLFFGFLPVSFPIKLSYCSSNYCDSNSCCSFSLFEEIVILLKEQ